MKKVTLLTLSLLLILKVFSQDDSKINNKILLVLDIQKQFTETTISDSAANSLINNINSIVGTFNPANVVYIQSIARVLNISFKGFRVDTLPNLELDSRLKIVTSNIITKNKANAFSSEELNKFIEKSGLNEIVVIGLLAEHCVKETLLGGKKKGYQMYYVPEAIAAKTHEAMVKAVKKLQKEKIKSIPLSKILHK
ncbi:MAG: isochorismatase family protein [Bacteroidales bacterium]